MLFGWLLKAAGSWNTHTKVKLHCALHSACKDMWRNMNIELVLMFALNSPRLHLRTVKLWFSLDVCIQTFHCVAPTQSAQVHGVLQNSFSSSEFTTVDFLNGFDVATWSWKECFSFLVFLSAQQWCDLNSCQWHTHTCFGDYFLFLMKRIIIRSSSNWEIFPQLPTTTSRADACFSSASTRTYSFRGCFKSNLSKCTTRSSSQKDGI